MAVKKENGSDYSKKYGNGTGNIPLRAKITHSDGEKGRAEKRKLHLFEIILDWGHCQLAEEKNDLMKRKANAW